MAYAEIYNMEDDEYYPSVDLAERVFANLWTKASLNNLKKVQVTLKVLIPQKTF